MAVKPAVERAEADSRRPDVVSVDGLPGEHPCLGVALGRSRPVYCMSPGGRAEECANPRILKQLSPMPESPLSHPPGYLANRGLSYPDCYPAGDSPSHRKGNPERHSAVYPAGLGPGNLPENSTENRASRVENRASGCSAGRLEGSQRGSLQNHRADELPSDSEERSEDCLLSCGDNRTRNADPRAATGSVLSKGQPQARSGTRAELDSLPKAVTIP
jgi:hypothetical protein